MNKSSAFSTRRQDLSYLIVAANIGSACVQSGACRGQQTLRRGLDRMTHILKRFEPTTFEINFLKVGESPRHNKQRWCLPGGVVDSAIFVSMKGPHFVALPTRDLRAMSRPHPDAEFSNFPF